MPAVDLLRLPLLGRLLLRGSRVMRSRAAGVPSSTVPDAGTGCSARTWRRRTSPTLLTWVHYRGLLVLVLLVAGNVFCLACPLLLPRELARAFPPGVGTGRALRNKWLAVALFVLILFAYELFGLLGHPRWTAWLIVAYFAGALVVDALFKHASFCKWVCPIGQFNFVASTVSPLEVEVRDPDVCATCATKDCIRGTPAPARRRGDPRDGAPAGAAQRGCELALFQPLKVGQPGLHLLPGLRPRLPARQRRAGEPAARRRAVGRHAALRRRPLHERKDLAAPGARLHLRRAAERLRHGQPGLRGAGLAEPPAGDRRAAPILAAAVRRRPWSSNRRRCSGWRPGWTRGRPAHDRDCWPLATRYAYSLVPLGFMPPGWRIYAFHFLTGVLTDRPRDPERPGRRWAGRCWARRTGSWAACARDRSTRWSWVCWGWA